MAPGRDVSLETQFQRAVKKLQYEEEEKEKKNMARYE